MTTKTLREQIAHSRNLLEDAKRLAFEELMKNRVPDFHSSRDCVKLAESVDVDADGVTITFTKWPYYKGNPPTMILPIRHTSL
jgi:hypothetical protein